MSAFLLKLESLCFDYVLNRLQQIECLILRQLNMLVQEVAWLKNLIEFADSVADLQQS